MAFSRKRRPPKPEPIPPGQERQALAQSLAESGASAPSACAICGTTVAADDARAIQTWRRGFGRHPDLPRERSWRLHFVCSRAAAGPGLLALLLAPDARPLRVDQAHADVARVTDVAALAYSAQRGVAPSDRGRRRPFDHVPAALRRELAEAVERRRAELTVPVHHPSGWPCGLCGTSHEIGQRWGEYRGRPACAGCARMIAVAAIPGNDSLTIRLLGAAGPSIPPGRQVHPFPLASDVPSYRPLAEGERRAPWDYLGDALPPVPPTAEQRLAELERRLTTV